MFRSLSVYALIKWVTEVGLRKNHTIQANADALRTVAALHEICIP